MNLVVWLNVTSIYWLDGWFTSVHPRRVLSFQFSTPLVPGGIFNTPPQTSWQCRGRCLQCLSSWCNVCRWLRTWRATPDVCFLLHLILNSFVVEEAVDNRGLYRNDCCNVCFHVLAMTRGQWLWSTDVQWLNLNNRHLPTMTVSRRCFKLLFWWFCAILPLEQCLGWRNACERLFSWSSPLQTFGFGKLLLDNAVP